MYRVREIKKESERDQRGEREKERQGDRERETSTDQRAKGAEGRERPRASFMQW